MKVRLCGQFLLMSYFHTHTRVSRERASHVFDFDFDGFADKWTQNWFLWMESIFIIIIIFFFFSFHSLTILCTHRTYMTEHFRCVTFSWSCVRATIIMIINPSEWRYCESYPFHVARKFMGCPKICMYRQFNTQNTNYMYILIDDNLKCSEKWIAYLPMASMHIQKSYYFSSKFGA